MLRVNWHVVLRTLHRSACVTWTSSAGALPALETSNKVHSSIQHLATRHIHSVCLHLSSGTQCASIPAFTRDLATQPSPRPQEPLTSPSITHTLPPQEPPLSEQSSESSTSDQCQSTTASAVRDASTNSLSSSSSSSSPSSLETAHPSTPATPIDVPTAVDATQQGIIRFSVGPKPPVVHRRFSAPKLIVPDDEEEKQRDDRGPLLSKDHPSSADDPFGVQRNWFHSLFSQLNFLANTNRVPGLKGRTAIVFKQVEEEFERLYNENIRDREEPFDTLGHRQMLMACLCVATYHVLYDELNDTPMVREMIRTYLGAAWTSLLKPIQRFKLGVQSWLLQHDMYQEAVHSFEISVKDMGGLVVGEGISGWNETVLNVHKCAYWDLFEKEDTPFLITEFCCHQSLMWLHAFRKYGVVVSLDECKAWSDSPCCRLRIARSSAVTASSPAPAIPASPATATEAITEGAAPGSVSGTATPPSTSHTALTGEDARLQQPSGH